MENKKVLYVTTKNIDYIRNVQIIKMLKNKYTDVKILYSNKKNYYLRIIEVNLKMIFEKRSEYNIIFFGFLPQLIFDFFYRKKKENQIIIIDFIISLYNTLVFDRKRVRKQSMLAKYLKYIDTKIASKADIVYTDTKTQAKYFEKEFNIEKQKFKILYLEANKYIYNHKVENIKINKNNKYIVMWFGTILPLQGVDVILDAAKLLESNDKILFWIIGDLKRLKIDKSQYKNIMFIPWASDKELAKYIKSADLCLGGHFSGKIERANREIPGKVFTFNAMNKKIILGKSEANQELFIEDNKKIFFVERGNPNSLAKKIEAIFAQRNTHLII